MTSTPTILNLTAHQIDVFGDAEPDGEVLISWRPTGVVARLRERALRTGPLRAGDATIPCWRVGYDDVVIDLPPPRPGVLLVVSRVLAGEVRRDDLAFPYPDVRNDRGEIVGCGGLARFDHDG